MTEPRRPAVLHGHLAGLDYAWDPIAPFAVLSLELDRASRAALKRALTPLEPYYGRRVRIEITLMEETPT